jgi:hypothetical protein
LKSASWIDGTTSIATIVGQVGLARERFLDLFLLGRHGDLRLGREAETAIGENLRVGVANGLVDGLGHHRAAVHLLQVAHRHLARTEAVELHLVLEVDQLGVRLGIGSDADADLELVLQSLGEVSVTCMVSIFFPLAPGLTAAALSVGRRMALQPAPVVG